MSPVDSLAPLAVIASMLGLSVRPTWVSAAVFAVAVVFFAAERVAQAYRAHTVSKQSFTRAAEEYEAEVAELRKELKTVTDAVKHAASTQTLARRGF